MKKTDYRFDFINQRIKSSNFKINENFSLNNKIEDCPEFIFSYSSNKKNKIVIVELGIRFSSEEAPFFLEVVTEGVFLFNEIPTKTTLKKISCINCNSILFPFVREFIADLTRRAGIPPFLLPPVNFIDFYKSLDKELDKAC